MKVKKKKRQSMVWLSQAFIIISLVKNAGYDGNWVSPSIMKLKNNWYHVSKVKNTLRSTFLKKNEVHLLNHIKYFYFYRVILSVDFIFKFFYSQLESHMRLLNSYLTQMNCVNINPTQSSSSTHSNMHIFTWAGLRWSNWPTYQLSSPPNSYIEGKLLFAVSF